MSYSELLRSFDRVSFQDKPEVFTQQYFSWSELNQQDVLRHLASDPNLFRMLLPPHFRAESIAANLAWYLDEVLLRDPLQALLVRVSQDDELIPRVEPMVARMPLLLSIWIQVQKSG